MARSICTNPKTKEEAASEIVERSEDAVLKAGPTLTKTMRGHSPLTHSSLSRWKPKTQAHSVFSLQKACSIQETFCKGNQKKKKRRTSNVNGQGRTPAERLRQRGARVCSQGHVPGSFASRIQVHAESTHRCTCNGRCLACSGSSRCSRHWRTDPACTGTSSGESHSCSGTFLPGTPRASWGR